MCMASSRAPKAAGITHPCHMHVWTRWAGEVSRKMSDVSVPRCDAIGVARLGRFPGQQCDRTSKLECCELTVVVSSRILTHKILGCGGAALWGRGCERPFRHSYTNVYTPCRPEWRGDLGFMHSAARGRGCATAPLSAVFSRHHLLHHHQQRPCAAQERRRCEYLRA